MIVQVIDGCREVVTIGKTEDDWSAKENEAEAGTPGPYVPLKILPAQVLETGDAGEQAYDGSGNVSWITNGRFKVFDVTLSVKIDDDVTDTN